LRSYVSTLAGLKRAVAGRIGAAEGIGGRVIFADFSSRMPGKIFSQKIATPLLAIHSRCHRIGWRSCCDAWLISTYEQIWLSVTPVIYAGDRWFIGTGSANLGAATLRWISLYPFATLPVIESKKFCCGWQRRVVCQRRLHQGHFIWPKSEEHGFSSPKRSGVADCRVD